MKTLKQYRYLTMAILTAALLGCGSDDESKTVPVNIAMAPDVSMNSQSVNGDAGINEQMAADQRVTADPVPDAALLEEPDAASPNDMTPNDDVVERPYLPMGPNDSLAQAACALEDRVQPGAVFDGGVAGRLEQVELAGVAQRLVERLVEVGQDAVRDRSQHPLHVVAAVDPLGQEPPGLVRLRARGGDQVADDPSW